MLSLQGNADLAEAPGFIAINESTLPTSDAYPFELTLIDDRTLSSRDRWALELVGKRLKRKEREFEDDLEFKSRQSRLFS